MADNIKITVGIRIKFRIKVVVGVKIMGQGKLLFLRFQDGGKFIADVINLQPRLEIKKWFMVWRAHWVMDTRKELEKRKKELLGAMSESCTLDFCVFP